MKGFYITVKNSLLEPKHIKAMQGDRGAGTVWLFLWLLDKMTVVDYEKGEGKVLGGKPITYDEVTADLGISRPTYKRWLVILRDAGYIKTLRAPTGLCITVFKAFKVFNQKEKRDGSPKSHRITTQEPSDSADKSHRPPHPRAIQIRQDRDKTVDNTNILPLTAVQEVVHHFFSLKGWEYNSTPSEKKLFARYLRPAKELLELCEQNIVEAKECLQKVADWAKSRELDWSIETVFKKWYEIDALKPKEKKPHWDGCRIFQKSKGGRWYIIRKGEVLELGRTLQEHQIQWM